LPRLQISMCFHCYSLLFGKFMQVVIDHRLIVTGSSCLENTSVTGEGIRFL
jgi:hypothetical protein